MQSHQKSNCFQQYFDMKPNRTKKKRLFALKGKERDGSVVVEAALVIPIILAIMFATLEICSGYYVQESITIAAYEGSRFAAREYGRVRGENEPPFTESDVTNYVTEILDARGVTSEPEIEIDWNGSATFDQIDVLDPIRVTVSCNTNGNSTFVFGDMANRTLEASVVFAAEAQRQ
jgi:Flp pilus assembly protein TadG